MPNEPYKPRIFISYAHADEPEKPAEGEVKWLSFVSGYLKPAVKHGAIELWTDRLIPGGADWEREIESKLRDCDIFILLVSPESLSSDYVRNTEVPVIRERQDKREAVHFYPLLLKPTPDIALDLVRDKNLRPRDAKPFSAYTLNERYAHMNDAANEVLQIAITIVSRKGGATAVSRTEATTVLEQKFPLGNIPITVPLHFLGREDELADIEAALKAGKGRVAALHGLRGVGKSTLAAAYVENHKAEYRAAWWIRAATPDTMRADLVALGVRLGWVGVDEKEEPALDAVHAHLRAEGEGLLLIFDNAIDAASVRPYLPAGGGARVLVTSNSPAWRGLATPVEIRVWPKEVGAVYLIARTGRENERIDAEQLSEALGGLTLAHEQAGAYCDRVGTSLAEYRKRFAAAPAPLLHAASDASPDYHGGLTVGKAFAVAIEKAAKLHLAAEPLIVHAAMLAREPIPLFLFSEAREKFGDPFASQIAGDGLDEAVAALRAFALVDRETIADEHDPAITTETIRLHRLVRTVAAGRLQGNAAEAARGALVRAISTVYPESVHNDSASWPRARRLDALALDLTGAPSPPEGAESMAANLVNLLGLYRHRALGAYTAAQSLFERALDIVERALGPDHHDTATKITHLATVHQAQGHLALARPLFERALAIREKALGRDHPDVASSLNNLALILEDLGEIGAARQLLEQALKIWESSVGEEHPDTATCLNNLGLLIQSHDTENATSLICRALLIREKRLGPNHLDTAISLASLGGVLQVQGNPSAALPLYRRALVIFQSTLGVEHPNTNRLCSNFARALVADHSASEALTLSEPAFEALERVLGIDHRWTKDSARVTSDALDALGRVDEAVALRTKYGFPGG